MGLIVCVCVCSPGESWLESEGHSGERKGGNKRKRVVLEEGPNANVPWLTA